MAKRAKSVPLIFGYSMNSDAHYSSRFSIAKDALLRHSKRVQELSISLDDRSVDITHLYKLLSSMLDGDMPLLNTLRLASNIQHYSFPLPRSIWPSLNHLPSLQSLELYLIAFPLTDMPHLPSLTNLTVQYDPSGGGLSVHWVTCLLQRTPNVEEVDLHRLYGLNTMVEKSPTHVALPHLRNLQLFSQTVAVTSELFDCLEFPNTAKIKLNHRNSYSPPDFKEFSAFSRLCQKFLNVQQSPPIERLLISVCEGKIEISISSRNATESPRVSLCTPPTSDFHLYLERLFQLPLFCIPKIIIRSSDSTKSPPLYPPFKGSRVMESSAILLEELELVGIRIPSDILCIPSLRRLDFRDTTATIHWITSFLQNTPNIQHVHIDTVTPCEDANNPTPPTIFLPHLESLELTSSSVAESKIFDYLHFPATTVLIANYPNPHTGGPLDLSSFERPFTNMATDGHPINEFYVYINDEKGTFELICFSLYPYQPLKLLRLTLPLVELATDTYLSLCSKLPLASIPDLWIFDITYAQTAASWRPLIPLFTNLTHLSLQWVHHDILEVLLHPSPCNNTKLAIFSEVRLVLNHGESLTRILKGRKELGYQIGKLLLEACEVNELVLEEWEELVEVEVDEDSLVTESQNAHN
ncbi:hypothetical protein ONZ45_g15315 [Pleurotus djamor]|nr:hypothetical protein ONZ45_g15315 [Pleurotus djamor]